MGEGLGCLFVYIYISLSLSLLVSGVCLVTLITHHLAMVPVTGGKDLPPKMGPLHV